MKRRVWFSFLAFVAFSSVFACSIEKRDVAQKEAPSITQAPATLAQAPGPSLYPLSVTLHDQRDRAIGLDAYRGHPVIISMFYASCPTACPLLVTHLKRIEAGLTPATRADVRVMLVSFDPARDTPQALAFIAKARELDQERWTLATGSDDDVRQIAAALGVSYRAGANGVIVHDSIVTVLDREGRVVAKADDAEDNIAALTSAVEAAAR
jgi:protein SCO1/2